MFKLKIGCVPDIMKEIFEKDNQNYNFRYVFLIKRHNDRLVYCNIGTAPFIVPKNFTRWLSRCNFIKKFPRETER